MSVKLRVSGLLASVCLFGFVASGAVFAQDAVVDEVVVHEVVVDEVVVDQPSQDAPAAEDDVPVVDPEADVVVDVPEATPEAGPVAVALGMSFYPEDGPNYEEFTDEELDTEVTNFENEITHIQDYIDEICYHGGCDESDGGDSYYFYVGHLQQILTHYQYQLSRANDEILRRNPIVVAPTVVSAEPTVVETQSEGPTLEYCAGLQASGDFADCGWRFSQSQ